MRCNVEYMIDFLRRNSSVSCPITGRMISEHFGISGSDVRRIINKSRQSGVPICSSRLGYYYSEDKEHISKTVNSIHSRISAQENAIRGLSEWLS